MLNKDQKKGLIFIISAPAGTGKTTLVKKLVQEFPQVKSNISYTTRQPRENEKNGEDYHFIDSGEFERKIKANELLEHVKLYGTYYGTSRKWVEGQLKKGHHVVLVIDTQGGLHLKHQFSTSELKSQVVLIFLEPPSMEELKKRLHLRQTESADVIEERLACSVREMEQGKLYDYKIINDQIDAAYQVLRSILIAEEHRIR